MDMLNQHAPNPSQPSAPESGGRLPSRSLSDENEALMTKIQHVLSGSAHDLRKTLIRDMVTRVIRMAEQPLDLLDMKIVNRAFKELRYAFRVFQPYEHCLKVSMYGSARSSR